MGFGQFFCNFSQFFIMQALFQVQNIPFCGIMILCIQKVIHITPRAHFYSAFAYKNNQIFHKQPIQPQF